MHTNHLQINEPTRPTMGAEAVALAVEALSITDHCEVQWETPAEGEPWVLRFYDAGAGRLLHAASVSRDGEVTNVRG